MDNPAKKPANYQPKNKVWHRIAAFAVFLALITGTFLLYQWKTHQQKAQKQTQLEQEQQQKEKAKALKEYQTNKKLNFAY